MTPVGAVLLAIGLLGLAMAIANNFVWVWAERNPDRPEIIELRGGILTWRRSSPGRGDPHVPSLSKGWTWHRAGDAWPVWVEQMHMSCRDFYLWPIPAVIGIAGLALLARSLRIRRQSPGA